MKVKIESYRDLRGGDVWLGMEFGSIDPRKANVLLKIDGCHCVSTMETTAIATLIAAGNDTVERKPEKVGPCTFHTCVGGVYDCGYLYGGILQDTYLEPFVGKRVKVTVEEL